MKKFIPQIDGILRRHMVKVPEVIAQASGIRIFGKRIKSLLFSTDVAIIKNCNADAVIAVYPFTPQPVITHALITASDVPVFCGVGGGITTGKRSVSLAVDAEYRGALGVVVNAPTPNELITEITENIDIPVVVTVISDKTDFEARVLSGATIFNVSAAAKTTDVIMHIRDKYPEFPIIATGGPDEDSILRTIEAGANAITYTPPTTAEILNTIMRTYRESDDIL